MIAGLMLLAGGVVLYALAGSALSRRAVRGDCPGRRTPRLLPLALGAALALACLVRGISIVDGGAALQMPGLLAPLWVVPAGLLAGALVVFAVYSPPSDGGGGSGPDDLPPPPDPDGPDGWAEFERQFRAYAGACDAARSAELLR